MTNTSIIQLIKSLSKEEKRLFKLASKKQSGNKDYLVLFDLIDSSSILDFSLIKEKFEVARPRASIQNTARYLAGLITDSLITSKLKDDKDFQLIYGYLRIRVLEERFLSKEAYKELKRLKEIANHTENLILHHLLYRFELEYQSNENFKGISEKKLIGIQMKMREILKDIHTVNEHYALYELLKYRIIHSGSILSEESKKQLNDLILSEMGLITSRLKNNKKTQKIHLLFQSFFLIHIGDYKAALGAFSRLNKLFEENKNDWGHPPHEYLSALDGILDNLRSIAFYDEMQFYISRLIAMDVSSYPEHFRLLVRKNVVIYELSKLLGTDELQTAVLFIKKIDPALLKTQGVSDYDKHSEFLFYISRVFYHSGDYKKAQKNLSEILLLGKINLQSLVYKAARLLSMIIHFLEDNQEYLEYEIRSYKRAYQKHGKLLKTEKLLFKAIHLNPKSKTTKIKDNEYNKMVTMAGEIQHDKYEMQLLKYFNYANWVRSLISK